MDPSSPRAPPPTFPSTGHAPTSLTKPAEDEAATHMALDLVKKGLTKPAEDEAATHMALDLVKKGHQPVLDEPLKIMPFHFDSSQVEASKDVEEGTLDNTAVMKTVRSTEGIGDQVLGEYGGQPLLTEEVRRCNRTNGRSVCQGIAHPGYVMCRRHVLALRKSYQNLQLKKKRQQALKAAAYLKDKHNSWST